MSVKIINVDQVDMWTEEPVGKWLNRQPDQGRNIPFRYWRIISLSDQNGYWFDAHPRPWKTSAITFQISLNVAYTHIEQNKWVCA